jgi:protein-tyrosine phosphatase
VHRHVPFEKAVNFRDLGGYVTADGGAVKWNRLFRCGHMVHMTGNDHARLAAMDTVAICDFRSAGERERNPAQLPPAIVARIHKLDIDPRAGNPFADFVRSLASGELTEADFLAVQRDTYRELVTDFAGQYAAMFRLLLSGQGRALVIHCTAGKDRTGVGAALILSALGVPEETIRADYMLSNDCGHLHAFIQYLVDQGVAGTDAAIPNDVKHARLKKLFGVGMDRLDVALDAMRDKAGSVDGYLRDALGITDEKRAKLREWFVE